MTLNYFVEMRKAVLRDLLAFLSNNDDIEKKKAIGVFGLKTGHTSKTISHMIDDLVNAGRITMDGDCIKCLV